MASPGLNRKLSAEEAERRARAEAEEAVRIRDQFLASVAHDLKNPLGVIKGYAQLLQRKVVARGSSTAEGLAQGLAKIDSMATRAVAQIDELLDLARLRANQPLALNTRPTDLVALTRTIVEEYQQAAAQHRIRLETPVDELFGVWDAPRLERMIGNLLSNAIKYSEPEQEIVVALRAEEGSEARAVLSVSDRGIGIPPADLPHIFEPFYRASNTAGQKPGTGLGLVGARHIVEQHGGSIHVESQAGAGATFTVRLPLVH